MANITVNELLEAGVHFGHQTRRWNPKMKKFIFGARNGIHILDLNKSLTQIQVACGFLHDTVVNGGQVLFVGTKKQAQQDIKEAALRAGMPYVVDRWLGGTLTNLPTIRRSVARMKHIDQLLESPDGAHIPKKEQASLRREQYKLHRNLDGIVNLEQKPAVMFVVDITRELIPLNEARRLEIPIVAIVDTNADPDLVQYPIAGNDDAIRSVKLITNVVAQTIIEALTESGRPVPVQPVVEAAPAAPAEVAALAN